MIKFQIMLNLKGKVKEMNEKIQRFDRNVREGNSCQTPTVLVIFGATGDLMAKKVLPALFHLFQKKKLPTLFRVIGVARRELSNAGFRKHVAEALEKHGDINSTKQETEQFVSLFSYHRGSVKNLEDYESLGLKLGQIDGEWRTCSNKLFYLGTPPSLYEATLRNLAESGLTEPCSEEEGWTRVIIEKPFGSDMKSARRLCKMLYRLFKKEQLYLIDHCLGKEMVQNILVFRFANVFFEGFWNNKFVKRIEVRLLEKIGVEGRGHFYDSVGALRDVGQNHLLEMLALVTMDNPVKLEPSAVRTNRARILENLRTPTENNVKLFTFRAQYKGYTEIEGVKPDSTTETYFKIVAFLETPRWQGVPIILESGKRLRNARKEIVVYLKHPPNCLCPAELREHYENKIVFSLEPRETIEMRLQSKEPGFDMVVNEKGLNCVLRDRGKRAEYVEKYEKLLFDCIAGDQTFFVSIDEIEASWRFIDPIIRGWRKNLVPLHRYEAGKNDVIDESKIVEQNLKRATGIRKEIGIVGLGKMGANLALNLIEKGWKVVGFNRTYHVTKKLEKDGVIGAASLKELAGKLETPRIVWLMVKAGKPVDDIMFGGQPFRRGHNHRRGKLFLQRFNKTRQRT